MTETYPNRTGTLFPLPEICLFLGYTLILTIDKVLFDTHGILGKGPSDSVEKEEATDGDPAEVKFINHVLELVQ